MATTQYLRHYDAGKWKARGFWRDLKDSCRLYSLWRAQAIQDVKNRYRRSWLGPFWITLSMLALIGGLGPLYAQLFMQPLQAYLPHLAVGVVVWSFVSSTTIELCSALHGSPDLLQSSSLPVGNYILRVVARNVIILAHNCIVAALVLAFTGIGLSSTMLEAIPALFVIIVAFVFYGYAISMIAARYRDVESLVATLTQLAFFLSPIVWRAEQLPAQRHFWMMFNPFAWMIDLVRAPLLHQTPQLYSWPLLLGLTISACAAAVLVYSSCRHRISHWV